MPATASPLRAARRAAALATTGFGSLHVVPPVDPIRVVAWPVWSTAATRLIAMREK
jgi:hypothetical protein